MPLNSEAIIGRDPECDIWIGSPSVSRRHCILNYSGKDTITVIDESRNGTVTSAKTMNQGESLTIQGQPDVFIFNNDVILALCFDEQQELQFLAAKNDLKN
jgi:pSer/pThr/pTyr-binding forkhead associated (FHA) protein